MAEANCYWIRFCQPIDNHMVCHLCAILFAYIRSVNTIFFRRFCRLACLCLELDCYVRVVNRYFMWFVFFSRSGGEVCCVWIADTHGKLYNKIAHKQNWISENRSTGNNWFPSQLFSRPMLKMSIGIGCCVCVCVW